MSERITHSLWWELACKGLALPRVVDQPQPGLYSVRFVKGGPPVAITIYTIADEPHAVVGSPDYPEAQLRVYKIWPTAKPLTEQAWWRLLPRNKPGGDLAGWYAPINLEEVNTAP